MAAPSQEPEGRPLSAAQASLPGPEPAAEKAERSSQGLRGPVGANVWVTAHRALGNGMGSSVRRSEPSAWTGEDVPCGGGCDETGAGSRGGESQGRVSVWRSGVERAGGAFPRQVPAWAKSQRYEQVEPAPPGPGNDESCPDQLCWLQGTLAVLTAQGGWLHRLRAHHQQQVPQPSPTQPPYPPATGRIREHRAGPSNGKLRLEGRSDGPKPQAPC